MSFLVTLALIAVCAKLWQDVTALKLQVRSLSERPTAHMSPAEAPAAIHRGIDAPASPHRDEVPARAEPVRAPPPVPETRASASEYEGEAAVDWEEAPARRSFTLEDLFGRMLPIWAGGLTLAIAGILVVKWSIDAGLLSPVVRVLLGLLFGAGLVATAEVAIRRSVRDPRIPQALCGAGIGSLYGAVLAANLMYGLVGPAPALAGMVVVTVAACALSMWFGAPSAVLGLAGGLLAPALVGGGEPHAALLSVYVAMVSGGVALLSHVQQRSWLGALSMAGAALWSLPLLLTIDGGVSSVAVGALILFSAFAVPLALPSDRVGVAARLAGAALGTVQMAALVALGGFGLLQWGMMAIATAVVLWISEDEDSFRDLPAGALAVVMVSAAIWHDASAPGLALVLIGFSALHALHAMRHLAFAETARTRDAVRLSVLPLACCAVANMRFPGMSEGAFAMLWGVGAAVTALASVLVHRSGVDPIARGFQPVAVGMCAAAAWSVLPVAALPACFALLAACLISIRGWRIGAAAASVAALVFALGPVTRWMAACLTSLGGDPLLANMLPTAWDATWSTLPLLVLGVALFLLGGLQGRARSAVLGIAAGAGFMLVHVLYRRLFGIASPESYEAWGMFDRSGWEALLAALAVVSYRMDRRLGAAFGLASLAHFGFFTLIAFNPLWELQIVGPAPVANLILVSHGIALALLWAGGGIGLDPAWNRARRVAQMVLVCSLVFSLLRQAAVGSLPVVPGVSQGEDIARSVAAVCLAIGFLVHGMWTSRIEWRMGSLVLMLGAVAKVFLFDASGLDGLARVASFAALGFSLIGVGWLYSRLLPGSAARA